MKKQTSFSLAAVIFAVSLIGCSTSKTETESPLSGSDLIKAVYFHDGSAVNNLPIIEQNLRLEDAVRDLAQLEQIRNVETEIVQYIETNDPAFISDFEKALKSGNHIEVSRAIDAGAVKISSVYKLLYGQSIQDALAQVSPLFVVSYRFIFVINEVAVQVTTDIENAALLAVVTEKERLLHEQLVDQIVRNIR